MSTLHPGEGVLDGVDADHASLALVLVSSSGLAAPACLLVTSSASESSFAATALSTQAVLGTAIPGDPGVLERSMSTGSLSCSGPFRIIKFALSGSVT